MDENEIKCTHDCCTCHGCSDEHEEDDGLLLFTDENGKDVKFEILDVVALEGKEYLVVLPLDDENDSEEGNVLILEIKQVDGEEVYDTVVDDEEAEKVFNKFQEQNDLDDKEESEEE